MDVVPEHPGAKLAKDKAFDIPPFKEAINAILEANSRNDFCISSVYDLLQGKFIENEDFKALPGNEQTLRNYVHHLEEPERLFMSRDTGGSMIMSSIPRPASRCSSTSAN